MDEDLELDKYDDESQWTRIYILFGDVVLLSVACLGCMFIMWLLKTLLGG